MDRYGKQKKFKVTISGDGDPVKSKAVLRGFIDLLNEFAEGDRERQRPAA